MLERQREGIAKAKDEGKYKGRATTARAKSNQVAHCCACLNGFSKQQGFAQVLGQFFHRLPSMPGFPAFCRTRFSAARRFWRSHALSIRSPVPGRSSPLPTVGASTRKRGPCGFPAPAVYLWQQGGRSEAWRPLRLGGMVCPAWSRSCCIRRAGMAITT